MLPLLWRAFFPPVFLIGMIKCSILFGWATPSEAGAVGAFGRDRCSPRCAGRLNFKMMDAVCTSAARTIAMVFFIIISATCFAYVYRALGGDDIVEQPDPGSGPQQLGISVPDHGDRVLPRLLPRLDRDHADRAAGVLAAHRRRSTSATTCRKADIVHWFVILMAVNLQTSFLTPPFGFALFYLKGIAPKEIKIQSIYLGIIPFVILQLVGLILVMAFPQLSLWLMRVS